MSNQSIVRVGGDVSGLQTSLQNAQNSLNQFANAANQAGQQSANSLNQAGNAATQNAQRQERAARSIERTLQREIALLEAGERGSRAYYESLARQRGVDPARFAPMLNQMDSLRQRTDHATISVGQFNNAMRMMPAQMTDIVTQLVGGQSPFLIAIQQGGQLRDSFGGFGNMFRGIASAISPFKLAVGGAVGAVGALGYALYQGSEESRAFQNALTLSGDRAGITAGQMQDLAATVGDSTHNWGTAREAVIAFAKEGRIAQEDYAQFSRAVTYYSQASGKDVSDLVSEFTKVGGDPVKAVMELSSQYRSMTADVYAQVKALIEQGKETEAVRLVQQKMAEEMEITGKKVVDNLGYIEKAWNGVKDAIGGAWEAMKSWGREQTLAEQLQSINAELAQLKAPDATAKGAFGFGLPDNARQAQIAALEEKREQLQKRKDSQEIQAAFEKKQAENNQRDVAFLDKVGKMADAALPRVTKLNKEIAELKEGLADFKANPANSKSAIKQAERNAASAIAAKQKEIADIRERESKQAERERKAAEREAGRGSKFAFPTTSAGLRIKAGAEAGGKALGGTYAMAHALQKMMGNNLVRFGAFRDRYHIGKNSTHNLGLAFDATPNPAMTQAQKEAVPQQIRAYLKELGFSDKDFFVQFEHAGKRNKNGTTSSGDHWHFNWRTKEAAARFASGADGSAKAFANMGLYKDLAPSTKKSSYEQYLEQSEKSREKAEWERRFKAQANGNPNAVYSNQVALLSNPEYKNWTAEQQKTELAKAKAADEAASVAKHREEMTKLNDEQAKRLALLGKTGEVAKLEYDLQFGKLTHLTEQEKTHLLMQKELEVATKHRIETDDKYGKLAAQLGKANFDKLSQAEFELSLLGKSSEEQERLNEAREAELQIFQAIADGAGQEVVEMLRHEYEERSKINDEIRKRKREAQEQYGNNWFGGVEDGMKKYMSSFKSMREEVSGLVQDTATGMTDAIADFVATGKGNFREFTQSVLKDISKMMIKMAIFNAMKQAGQSMSGYGGWVGAIGSAISSGFSDGGYTGNGGKYEPAGIVHKGEYVLSQNDLRQLGGVGVVENLLHRARGYSSGGLVGANRGVLAHAQAVQAAAPVINITVNVEGSNHEEARQGAEEGVQAGLRKMMSEIADSRIFEHCRPGNVIYNVAKA